MVEIQDRQRAPPRSPFRSAPPRKNGRRRDVRSGPSRMLQHLAQRRRRQGLQANIFQHRGRAAHGVVDRDVRHLILLGIIWYFQRVAPPRRSSLRAAPHLHPHSGRLSLLSQLVTAAGVPGEPWTAAPVTGGRGTGRSRRSLPWVTPLRARTCPTGVLSSVLDGLIPAARNE